MKKIFTVFIALILVFSLCVTTAATNGTVNNLTASGTTTAVTVSGSISSGALAVMTEVLDNTGSSVIMYSFPVSETNFSGTISGVNLTPGATYTLRAADYEGGSWTTSTFTVPSSFSNGLGGLAPITLYNTIEGTGNKYIAGSANSNINLTFRFSGAYENFQNASVNGKTLKKGIDYSATRGSTIIALSASFLKTLPVGTHTIQAAFSDGYAQTTFSVVENKVSNPHTGA